MSRSALIIDDDAGIADALSAVLDQEGYQVRVAPDGRAALELLDKEPAPQLIFVDLSMPGMDGYAFLRQLHHSEALKRIPTFVMSAGDLDHALEELHVSGWLRKPIQLAALQELLRPARATTTPRDAV